MLHGAIGPTNRVIKYKPISIRSITGTFERENATDIYCFN